MNDPRRRGARSPWIRCQIATFRGPLVMDPTRGRGYVRGTKTRLGLPNTRRPSGGMTLIRHRLVAAVGTGALAVALAACGSSNSSGANNAAGGGTGDPWILGTTDTVTALDPAGSYDLGSSTMEYNIYQTLVTIPPNSTKIVGDAAKSCTYDDPTTLTCTLNPDEKFSNGDPLTSSDVKYSFERAIKIQDPNGAAIYLLGSITDTAKDGTVTMNKGAIETPDDQTVVFHLDHPDTTFQYVLTYPGAAAIVDEDVFPADKKLADDQVDRLRPLQAEPVQVRRAGRAGAQPELHGPEPGQGAPGLRQVLHASRRRSSSPSRTARSTSPGGAWPDRHHLPQEGQQRHRRHAARARRSGTGSGTSTAASASSWPSGRPRPRSSTATPSPKDAYDGTVDPLYSIVPPGYGGQNELLQGGSTARPDVGQGQADPPGTPASARRSTSPSAGRPPTTVRTPRTRRTRSSASWRPAGCSRSTLKSTEWEQYQTHLQAGRLRPVHPRLVPGLPGRRRLPVAVPGRRWLLPERLQERRGRTSWSPRSRAPTDQAKRQQIFGQLQDIAAKDVPFIPSWVGQNTAVYGKGMTGRREHARPVVHLPVLAGHQERLSDLDSTRSWGETLSGLSPRAVRRRPSFMSRVLVGIPAPLHPAAHPAGDPDDLGDPDAGLLRPARGARGPGLGGARRQARPSRRSTQRREALGLNRPLIVQYWDYLSSVAAPRLRDHLHRQPAGPRRDPRQRRRHAHPDRGRVHHRAGGRHPARPARGPLPRHRVRTP